MSLPIAVNSALKKLGRDIKDMRIRRRITMDLMAQRAGISRVTLSKIEKGSPTVSMGAYATVLFILGMLPRLRDLASWEHDETGRLLDEERLPQRVRLKKSEYSANKK